MSNKEKYIEFCKTTYVPIFSQPWWMDAVCGEENWDVWLYYLGEELVAAMPYYMEKRGEFSYITKAPLTQNNGIIFKFSDDIKNIKRAEIEEKVIDSACEFISSLALDVYEQQFRTEFQNWQPFFWNNFTNVLRYTYVIEDTSDMAKVEDGFSANYRKNIRKGKKNVQIFEDLDMNLFYMEHSKIFEKQGLPCPFSADLWVNLYKVCTEHDSGKIIYSKDDSDNIHSLMFIIWDEKKAYPLLGGYMPEFASSQSYPYLTYYSIQIASQKGLQYDFEGSMIKRIAKSFREFGGVPKPYYRIRKVFNADIVLKEAEDYISKLKNEIEEK